MLGRPHTLERGRGVTIERIVLPGRVSFCERGSEDIHIRDGEVQSDQLMAMNPTSGDHQQKRQQRWHR